MSILPEKLVEFFSAPNSALAIYEKVSPEVAEVAAPRPSEIRAGVINIIDIVGVRPTQPFSVAETASRMGRVAQAEASPEVKTDASVAQASTTQTPTEVRASAQEIGEAEARANVLSLYGDAPTITKSIEDQLNQKAA